MKNKLLLLCLLSSLQIYSNDSADATCVTKEASKTVVNVVEPKITHEVEKQVSEKGTADNQKQCACTHVSWQEALQKAINNVKSIVMRIYNKIVSLVQ